MTPANAPISLIIPTYNRADLLPFTLDSAIAQIIPFAEIIVVDDGSTDDTCDVLRRYESRVKIISGPNSGVQAARNAGAQEATNELITFCDSDDLLEPTFTENLSSWLASHPEIDIAYSNFLNFDEERIYADKLSLAPAGYFSGAIRDGEFLTEIPDLYERSLAFQPFFPSGMTIRKSFFQRIKGYDTKFRNVGAEDWEFTLRAISSGKVALCIAPQVKIRRHEGNDSRDLLRMNLGEAAILEHALLMHEATQNCRAAVLQTIDERLLMAFDIAFAAADFDTARSIVPQMRKQPNTLKFRLKKIIIALPKTARRLLWQITQADLPRRCPDPCATKK